MISLQKMNITLRAYQQRLMCVDSHVPPQMYTHSSRLLDRHSCNNVMSCANIIQTQRSRYETFNTYFLSFNIIYPLQSGKRETTTRSNPYVSTTCGDDISYSTYSFLTPKELSTYNLYLYLFIPNNLRHSSQAITPVSISTFSSKVSTVLV